MNEDESQRRDIATRFQTNNKFWRRRSTHGRKPIFETPDQLWDACEQYFDYIDDNPEMIAETVKFQGEASVIGVPHRLNMSIDGMVEFLNISLQTWHNYKEKPDFLEVTERVERIIRIQKMDGAITGQFKESIIARELGLSDRQDHNHTGGGSGGRTEIVIRKYDPEIDGPAHDGYAGASEEKPDWL